MNTPRYIHVIITDKENEAKELMLASSYNNFNHTKRLVSNMIASMHDDFKETNKTLEDVAKAAHTLSGATVVEPTTDKIVSYTIKVKL